MKHQSFVSASLLALVAFTAGCKKESAVGGPNGTLELTKPSNQSLAQGQSNPVSISIDRHGFANPVDISFSNLPKGVTVNDDVIPAGDSKKNFVLIAAPDAAIVEKHVVTVRAKALGLNPSQTFELTVKPKS